MHSITFHLQNLIFSWCEFDGKPICQKVKKSMPSQLSYDLLNAFIFMMQILAQVAF